MEETKNTGAQGEEQGTRDEEATSSETLSDIEANEKVSTAGGAGGSGSSALEGSSPEPDAGGEGRADGSETGGPM
ncbi:MAG TPA: hypothetical protein VKB12_19620 [Pyrinomonadaceae bacterium]|nr:hypothetical protein [Pyrinomonadaceae bacterium]